MIGDEAFVPNIALRRGCMSQFIDTNLVQYVSTYAPIPIFISPNKNPTADAIVSVYSHELLETVTDVDSTTGWFRDCDKQEVADLCAYKFDRILRSSDGSHYNVQMGSNKYLLQTVWANKGNGSSGCVLSYSSTPISSYPSYVATDVSTMLYVYIAVGAGAGLLVFSALMSLYYYFCGTPYIIPNEDENSKRDTYKKKRILKHSSNNGDLYPDEDNVNGENPLVVRDGNMAGAEAHGLSDAELVYAVDDSTGQMYAIDSNGRMLRMAGPSSQV